MAQSIEAEIKLVASTRMLAQLRSDPWLAATETIASQVTTYFDTPDQRLYRAGASLRLRTGDGPHHQTLKLARGGAAVRRSEWNRPGSGDFPDPSAFPLRPQAALQRLLGGAPLVPSAITRIERTTRRMHFGGSEITVTFDHGTLAAGGREQAIDELELELSSGRLTDLLALALKLPLGPELGWSLESKAAQGHRLAFDLPLQPARARLVGLSPDMRIGAAFQAIGWNCLAQLLANSWTIRCGKGVEGVHQARVAIRRLRAALSLFGKLVDEAEAAALEAELKAAARTLAPARELEVLAELVGRTLPAEPGEHDHRELYDALCSARDKAAGDARKLLAQAPFQQLMLQVAHWLEAGEWLTRLRGAGLDQPVAPFAKRILKRRTRKLKRAGQHLRGMSVKQRHRLRIAVKELRYASEFFAGAFGTASERGPVQKFLVALGLAQDRLGELNDRAVAGRDLEAHFAGLDPIIAARLGSQLAGLLAASGKSHRRLLNAAAKALDRALDAPPWWSAKRA